jgi:thiol-disulfide isomerase/thioredoxin
MKKVLIFGGIIVTLFVALYFTNSYSNQIRSEGNPFGKAKLHPSTISQLNDPLYENLILPDQLQDRLANEEDIFVYFYSPECEFCKRATPILVPLTEELGVNLYKYNLIEFQQGWQEYSIESTPTIVHFKNGLEEIRVVGLHDREAYKEIFEKQLKNE